MTLKEIRPILDKIDLCSCGSGIPWEILFQLLDRASKWHDEENDTYNDKAPIFYDPMEGVPASWVEFGAKVLTHFNLLEHGGSVGRSWFTDEGRMLYRWLKEQGVDDKKWPDGWDHHESCKCGCNA